MKEELKDPIGSKKYRKEKLKDPKGTRNTGKRN